MSGVSAAGQTGETDPRAAELGEIREEISRMEARLGQMRARESTLEDRLLRVKLELELQETRLGEAVAALDWAREKVDSTELEVAELGETLGTLREDLRRRMAGLYRLGRHGYLRLFVSLRADRELLPAIRQLRYLARRDRDTFDRFRATRDELEAQRTLLVAEQRDAELWQHLEQERRDELASVRRRHERVLSQVERERRRLAKRVDELADKERKLVKLIDSLVEGSLTPLEGTPIQDFRGVLDWPVPGEVTVEFGPRRDPRYRTEVPHNGLDIEVESGAGVRAVFPGRVLYASQFEGYGTMVVVYHPGKVFTLYAGLQELSVGKDDVLSLGDVLGTATGTLYFEIRIENQPEDPRRWLR